MEGIWILAENQQQTLELLNKGQELARDLDLNLSTFSTSRILADDYIAHGADEVYLLPPLPEKEVWSAYVVAIAEQASQFLPAVILIAGTMRGREMGARLAQKLNAGLCSGCININLNHDTGQVEMERLIYGGTAVQTVVCTTTPQMATIAPRTFDPAPFQEGHQGQISEVLFVPESAVKVQEQRSALCSDADLARARVIVCAGRGIEGKADLEMIQQLARTVDGQVGCTRPISEELHWLPEDSCIGLSGKQVKPELYIGVGVSGQIQHTTGIRDSKVILAINRDENAPIFDVSDFGIIGNLYEAVPALIKELEKKKG